MLYTKLIVTFRVCMVEAEMADLEQQLRELSKDRFEAFVHQYLVAQYPCADVMRVDGSGGDEGIDSFRGNLTLGAAIWQSKHFPARIGPSQKKQILKSIKTAFATDLPILWTLCVPIDLRTPEHRWFQQKVVSVYGGPDRIKLLQASNFATELQHNRELRESFFPDDAYSTMMQVRKVVTGTEDKTIQQVGTLATEYAVQFMDRFTRLEPRLKPVLVIGGTPQMRSACPQQGLVLSITEGESTAHLFARDLEKFNLDPLKFRLEIRSESQRDFRNAFDTGQPVTFAPGQIVKVHSTSPLLRDLFGSSDISQLQLQMVPQIPAELAGRTIPLRIIAGFGADTKELIYVPFKVTQGGRREITLKSQGSIPAEITLTIRFEEGVTLTIRPQLPGSDVQALERVLQFGDKLEETGRFQILSLEYDVPIIEQTEPQALSSSLLISPFIRKVIADAAIVSKVFKTPLQLPDQVGRKEAEALHTLKTIATGEDFTDVAWTSQIKKLEVNLKNGHDFFNEEPFAMKIDFPAGWRKFEVFGKVMEPGPLSFVSDKTTIENVAEARKAYIGLAEGEQMLVKAQCPGPCRFVRSVWDPGTAVLIH